MSKLEELWKLAEAVKRLPPGVLPLDIDSHQYLPDDMPEEVAQFLNAATPDTVLKLREMIRVAKMGLSGGSTRFDAMNRLEEIERGLGESR